MVTSTYRARATGDGVAPPEQRAALELAYLGGKTSAEVSELEGIPSGTAKTRIRAALLRLREAMAPVVPRTAENGSEDERGRVERDDV